MRLINGRHYVLAEHPGISGFKRFDETEYRIVTAVKARRYRNSVVGEFLPTTDATFRLDNGAMPEYQPVVKCHEALQFLADNPFASIMRVDSQTHELRRPLYSSNAVGHWNT